MAWFGDGLSSLSNLKGQITNFTKEVLSEGIVNEIDDRSKQLEEANEKCAELQELLNSKDAEIALLKRHNCELQKTVVELNIRVSETQQDANKDDEGGGFFWDPLSAKNHDVKSNKSQVKELQEQLIQSNLRVHELEEELEKYKRNFDKKDPISDGHQKAELLRAKQDIVNRIIQIGEKGREAEKNMKKLQLDETTFINDFRAAISKLECHEQIHLIRCALKALEFDNSDGEMKENEEKSNNFGKRKNTLSPKIYSDESNTNGIHNREADLLAKVKALQEENKNLSCGIEELDQQHAQSIEKILALKEELQKKHKVLQTAYESLYVDYNAAQEKLSLLETELSNSNSSTDQKIIPKLDKDNQTDLLITNIIRNDENNSLNETTNENKSIQTEEEMKIQDTTLKLLTKRVNEIVKNSNIQYEEGEHIFEIIAKQLVDTEWKKNTLERKISELTEELKQVNDVKESLQIECDELQNHVESLDLEIQHMKSNLPSIPEASEERVASLESEIESMSQRIKQLQNDNEILNYKNSELITAMNNVEGSLRNQENLEAEVRNTKQQLEIAQQQLAGVSKNVENNENMMEDLSRKLHAALNENNELRKRNDALSSRERQMTEQLSMYEAKCKSLDENIELIEELKLDISNVKKELQNSIENSKRLENELTLVYDAKKEIERDMLALSQENEQLEMELSIIKEHGVINEDNNLVKELRDQVETLQREKNDLEYDLINMRQELDIALNRVSTAEQKNEKISNKIQNSQEWKDKVDLLKRELVALQQEHTFLKEESTTEKAELEEVRNKLKDWEEKYNLLQKELQMSEVERKKLSDSYDKLRYELEDVKDKEKDEVRKLKEIEKNWLMSEEKCRDLSQQLNNFQADHELKLTALEQNNKKLEEVMTENETFKKEFVQLRTESQRLNELKSIVEEKQLLNEDLNRKVAEIEALLAEKNIELKNLQKTRTEAEMYQQKCVEFEEKIRNIYAVEERCQKLDEEIAFLRTENEKLTTSHTESEKSQLLEELNQKIAEIEVLKEEKNNLEKNLAASQQELQATIEKSQEAAQMSKETIENLSEIIKKKDDEIQNIKSTTALDYKQQVTENESVLTSLRAERDELVKLVQVKHNESIQYHKEIERMTQLFNEQVSTLQSVVADRQRAENLVKEKESEVLWAQNELQVVRQRLKNLEESTNYGETCNIPEHSTKLSQLTTLNEKCNALEAALVKEQSSNRILQNQLTESQQRENVAAKNLERLQAHLVEIEENHTEEALLMEQSKKELETKLIQAEEVLKNNSTVYTSASIRANQQVETLQQQMALIIQQRDDIQNKLSAAEDKVLAHTASLTNLQIVLEQFQRDKENDIRNATEKIRQQLNDSYKKQEELNGEIANLKHQLAEAKGCLQAASRLSEQLDKKTERIQKLNEEVTKLTELVNTAEERIQKARESGEGKVDKNLMKNLLLGFLAASNTDKLSVLKVFATVLDFNEAEREKSGINSSTSHGGWFSGLLTSGGGPPTKDQEASLSAAFIRFLENESKPMSSVPALPISNTQISRPGHSRQHSTSSNQSGLLLSNVTLPAFPDFIPSRNTGSILKEVLKDS
ncbi:thyroid receptor-interacting protein 11-like [Chelonus insularis]|uniref:thyroid receptor-interacting protein 11-like n=1 Tax=Chelonus insularis TaxID=460826 RepID=UPI00158D9F99|nr:thyroid receptor-interacting protein 11-like [Chelonus insularis]